MSTDTTLGEHLAGVGISSIVCLFYLFLTDVEFLATPSAPVFDACGRAGGGIPEGKVGGGATFFVDTVHAKGGDLGSTVLPELPSGTVWKVGEEVETTWGMRAQRMESIHRISKTMSRALLRSLGKD